MGIVIESQTFVGVASSDAGSRAQVWLPAGFTLTGGGAFDLGRGEASTLTACCPTRDEDGKYTGWAAAGSCGEAPMAVYAVGIRILKDGVPVRIDQQVFCATSALVSDPGVTVRLGAGWIGTGGGAQDNHACAVNANLVTANYPLLGADGQICGWSASARAGEAAASARVTAFVVGIRTVPPIALDAKILASCLRPAFPSTPMAPQQGQVSVAVGARVGGHGNGFAASHGAACAAMLETA